MPSPDRVPAGPHRVFLDELHKLYGLAGRPAARWISKQIYADVKLERVSYETVSALLRGGSIPSWPRIVAVIVILNRTAVQAQDEHQLLIKFNGLWQAVGRPSGRPATPPATVSPQPPPPRPPVTTRRVHGPLPALSPHFSGREGLLTELSRLHSGNPGAPLFLCGPIGVGKTQLALAYVGPLAADHPVLWWIDASTRERAYAGLRELAVELGVPLTRDHDQNVRNLYRRLTAPPRTRSLLVFDGADPVIRPLLPPFEVRTVVTTRDAGWARDSAYVAVDVRGLDRAEAMQFLRRCDPQVEPRRAERVLQQIGGNPLSLAQIGAIHAASALTWEELTERVADSGLATLAGADPPPHYPVPAVVAVRSALTLLTAADPVAASLVPLLAAFGPAPISVRTLLEGAAGLSGDLGRIVGDGVGLRRKWPVIVRSGLARLDTEQQVSVPSIVRFALREILSAEVLRQAVADAGAILVAADPGPPDNGHHWDRHLAIAPHVRATRLVERREAAAYRTVRNQLRFLFLAGRLAEAQRLGREAAEAWSSSADALPDVEVVLHAKREWANALRADGRYAEAESLTAALSEQVGRVRQSEAMQGLVLAVDRSRGHDLRIAGRYHQALELDRATYAGHVARFGETDQRTVAAHYNLGVSSRFVGLYAEAEAIDRAAYRRQTDRLSAGDRGAWRTVNALAEDLYGLGRYREVLDLLSPLLAADRTGDPPRLLRARRTRAIALRRIGDIGPAVQELSICHHICVAELGEAQELSLATATSYANALRDAGRLDDANYQADRVRRGYERAMGVENPLVFAARVNRLAIALGDDDGTAEVDEAEDVAAELTLRLGRQHPFALVAAVTLAHVLARAGEPDRACRLSEQAYDTCRRVLGPRHPDTLIAGANMIADRAACGGAQNGVPGPDSVLSPLRAALSPRHPLILRVAGGERAVLDIEPPSA